MSAMATRTVSSPARLSSLPQYGFGAECSFQNLVQHNNFLFRVYTPRRSADTGDLSSDNYFVAKKFDQQTADAALSTDVQETHSYEDVIGHLDWMTRSNSPYISTSFSFAWSLWEAMRRYSVQMKHDVEIAVIDARQVLDRAVTVTDILRSCAPKQRHSDYWKWYQFSLESQDVFIYGAIPNAAILSSIPLRSLIDSLPSYYFPPTDDDDLSSFKRFVNDHTHHRTTYRRFCLDISSQFSRLSREEKLCDSTTGAVRFALAFLRPWFSRVVLHDFDLATSVLSDFAFAIAQWPAKHWVTQQSEMFDMVYTISRALGDEIRRKNNDVAIKELTHLQSLIGALEQDIRSYTAKASDLCASSMAEQPAMPEERHLLPTAPDSIEFTPSSLESQSSAATPFPRDILSHQRRKSSVSQALFTGFILGAFATLCMISSQRRHISNQFR